LYFEAATCENVKKIEMAGKEEENKESNDVWLPAHYPQGAQFLQKKIKKKRYLLKASARGCLSRGL
jgi:hypothetical protein